MCHQTGQFGCRCGSASSSEDLNNVNAAPPRVVTVKPSKGPVVVIGGIAVDVLSKPQNTLSSSSSEQDVKGHSIPGHITMTAGGVGRNIAETLSKFGMLTTLISALGTGTLPDDVPTHFRPDQFGQFLLDDCRKKKIALLAPVIKNKSTAVYSAMSYPDGTFRGGVAHMEVLSHVIPSVVDRYQFQKTKFIVLDCNIPVATISHVLRIASSVGIPTLVEPTSALKATKLRDVDNLKAITFLKPNRVELEAIAVALRPSLENPQQQPSDVLLKILIDAGIQHVILTNGAESVKVAKADTSDPSKLEIHEIPIETSSKLVDVNGAGDSLVGGFIFAYLSGLPLLQAVRFGLRAARLTSESTHSVSPLLNSSLLQEFASSIAKL